MSKFSISIFMMAIILIVVAVALDVPFFRNGSGVILLVGLGYAYTVAKREVGLFNYVVKNRDDSIYSEAQTRNEPSVPKGTI